MQALTIKRTGVERNHLWREDSVTAQNEEVKLLSPTLKTQLSRGSFSKGSILYGYRGDYMSQLAQDSLGLHLLPQLHY